MLRKLCFLAAAVAQVNEAFEVEVRVPNLLQDFGVWLWPQREVV